MKATWISWSVILLIAIGLPTIRAFHEFREPVATPTTQPTDVSADIQSQLTSKQIVGSFHVMPNTKPQLVAQIDAMEKLPAQRLMGAVLAGELIGTDAAVERLRKIEGDGDATAFRQRYEEGTPLPKSVSDRYGYLAELAASAGKPDTDPQRAAVLAAARRTFITLMSAVFVGLGVAVVSLGLFVTGIVLLSTRKIHITVPSPTPRNASLYVQAFAIYLGVFVFGSILVEVFDHFPAGSLPDKVKYLPMIAAVVLAAVWPTLRGVRWEDLRVDWGLHTGRNLLVEPVMGILGYLAGLPVVAMCLGITLFLSWVSGAQVSHPIQKELLAHKLLMAVLAVVWAPITEELMFRGALLSHLRVRFNTWISAVLSGAIFAAIHPQGWAAIPLLGSIGFVFAMVRQWRGTLLASMTSHALNNGTIVGLLILAAR